MLLPLLLLRLSASLALATALAGAARYRRSLSPRGALAAVLIGLLTALGGLRPAAALCAFFFSASRLTKWAKKKKKAKNIRRGSVKNDNDEDPEREGRGARQVLANGLVGALAAFAIALMEFLPPLFLSLPPYSNDTYDEIFSSPLVGNYSSAFAAVIGPCGPLSSSFSPLISNQNASYNNLDSVHSSLYAYWLTWLSGAILGHFAACAGDTFSSEIGGAIGDKRNVRLITQPWRVVPAGTNGGITFVGLIAAALGGFIVGIVFFIVTASCGDYGHAQGNLNGFTSQWQIVLIGIAAGLGGSLVDSVLGATLQYSGYDARKLGGAANRNRSGNAVKIVETPTRFTTRVSGMAILDNNGVNFLASLITSVACAYSCVLIFA